MAPEIARESLSLLREGDKVIDPMCGSGTVLRAAIERGLVATGTDIDPLSVLMSRVWTTPLEAYRLLHDGRHLCRLAQELPDDEVGVTSDRETQKFIDFWFAEPQKTALSRLAAVIRAIDWPTKDALAVALSRIIITKERAASLARDTSHSRPHRVVAWHDYDVYAGFSRAVKLIVDRLKVVTPAGLATVHDGDARNLDQFSDDSYDLALTSPPYLNAIDYLRGHRLTLVWLGYDIGALRTTRAASVGSERGINEESVEIDVDSYIQAGASSSFGERHRGWVRRYASDMEQVLRQLQRVTKPDGRVVLVVGNSFIRGASVDNAGLIHDLAVHQGLLATEQKKRRIPARRRYLPPPGGGANSLDSRMRTEVVMSFTVG